jgi:hypothetical protein
MTERPTADDLPRFVLDLDDLADGAEADDLELPAVAEPRTAPDLALGSELRPRVYIEDQPEPSELDVMLMSYLLDLEPPG